MKKKIFRIIILLGIICLSVTSCVIEDDPDNLGDIHVSSAYGDGTFTDTVDGTAYGYHFMTVSVDLVNGIITDVRVKHTESPEYGVIYLNKAIPLIKKANSFDVDAGSGATETKRGLTEAGKNALRKIPGVDL